MLFRSVSQSRYHRLETAKAYAKAFNTPGVDIKHFERLQDRYVNAMFDCGGYHSLPAKIQKEITLIFQKGGNAC